MATGLSAVDAGAAADQVGAVKADRAVAGQVASDLEVEAAVKCADRRDRTRSRRRC